MGDCQIRIQISNHALKDAGYFCTGTVDKLDDQRFSTIFKTYTADTTLRELIETKISFTKSCEIIELNILSLLEDHEFTLWDCTTYPATNITDWPLNKYKEKQGPNVSITLHEAKWFPSGTLQILGKGESYELSNISEDDVQYNITQKIQPVIQGTSRVLLAQSLLTDNIRKDKPLPSQIMTSVLNRFSEESNEVSAREALLLRQKNKQDLLKKQQLRLQNLDEQIQKVKEAGNKNVKNKKVSDQVRKMLIRSRAIGRNDLKPEDRVYLHCFISIDEDNIEDCQKQVEQQYCFYSIQETVGRILDSFKSKSLPTSYRNFESELLVLDKQSTNMDGMVYRRIPVLMRIYETISSKILNDFDEVIIRFYNPEKHEGTTNTTENLLDVEAEKDKAIDIDSSMSATLDDSNKEESSKQYEATEDPPSFPLTCDQNKQENTSSIPSHISTAIIKLDENDQKRKKSIKQSASVIKVQQMQMKSKAKGDSKRIKQATDRFYFELVTVIDHGSNEKCILSSTPWFLAYTDSLQRIVRDCSSLQIDNKSLYTWELFIPNMDNDENNVKYTKVDDCNITFHDAEKQIIIKCFQRIVLRYYSPN